MNKTIKLVSLLAPLALLLPAQAQDCGQGSCDGQERAQRTSTQDPKPDGKRQDQEGIRKRLLKKYDANGDGKLGRKELAQARKDGALPGRGQRGQEPQDEKGKKPKAKKGKKPQDENGKKPKAKKGKKPQDEKGKKPKDGEGRTEAAKSFTREDYARAKKKLDGMVAEGKVSQEDADRRLNRMRQAIGERARNENTEAAKSFTREDYARAKKKLDGMVAEGKVSQKDADGRLNRMRKAMGARAKDEKGKKPQDGAKQGPQDGADRRAKFLKKYDANKDGKLDRKEMAQARKDGAFGDRDNQPQDGEGRRPRDGKGKKPSDQEGQRPDRSEMRTRLLKKYDANKDGKLDREELAQARKDGALPDRRQRGGAEGQGDEKGEEGGKRPKGDDKAPRKKRSGKQGKVG